MEDLCETRRGLGSQVSKPTSVSTLLPTPPSPSAPCLGTLRHHFRDHAILLFLLLLPVCHQGTNHGGPGSDLDHRQHPHPTQRLPPQEGSQAVMGRKPAPEPDFKLHLQLDLVESTLSEFSPEVPSDAEGEPCLLTWWPLWYF